VNKPEQLALALRIGPIQSTPTGMEVSHRRRGPTGAVDVHWMESRAVTEQCWPTERNNGRTEKKSPNRTDGQRTSKKPEITDGRTDGRKF
jgi:hypothetical protein